MKKFLLGAVVAMLALAPLASLAETVETPIGSVTANSDGGTGGEVYLDGAAENPDPLDGYIGVEGDLSDPASADLHCSDEGGWNDQDGDDIPDDEDDDPEGQGRDGCNPEP